MSYELLTAKEYCVVTFQSTQCALLGEKHLVEKNVDLIVIPTPREISASCGLALKVFCNDIDMIRDELAGAKVAAGGFYKMDKTEQGNMVTEVGGLGGKE